MNSPIVSTARNVLIVISLAAFIGLSAAGCRPQPAGGDGAPTVQQTAKVPVVEVWARDAQRTVDLPATVEGYEVAELMSKIDGYVGQVHVNIGDQVRQGQRLATLKIPELGDEVTRKQELVKQCDAEIASQQAQVGLAQARVDEQMAMQQLRQSELQRYQMLVRKGALNQQKLDEAQLALAATTAGVRRAQADVDAANAAVAAAAARRDVARAELQMAETMAAYRQITAPFDGLITARRVDPGDFVRPATGDDGTPLFTISQTAKVRLVVFLPMDLAGYVNIGDAAILHDLPSLPGQQIEQIGGRPLAVSRYADSFDQGSRMMRAELDVDNTQLAAEYGVTLKPGNYGKVALALESFPQSPTVPAVAIETNDDGGTFVVRIDEANVCQRVPVQNVMQQDRVAHLAAGRLQIGDRVLVEASGQKLDGQPLDANSIEVKSPKDYR